MAVGGIGGGTKISNLTALIGKQLKVPSGGMVQSSMECLQRGGEGGEMRNFPDTSRKDSPESAATKEALKHL